MKENKLKILLLYRELIPSIILCGLSQLSYLEKQGEIGYRAINVSKVKTYDINWADVIILGRLDSYYERKLTEIASKANKYLIYMIDDDLLNLPDYISCAAYFNQKEIKDNVSFMLNISDAIISPSPILLEKYGKGKVKIKVEEPIIYPFEYKAHDLDKPIKIGFAGSIDRIADLDLLYEVLKEIKFKYKERVQIEFFGAIPSFAKELEANCYKYSDSYKGYIDKLNSLNWDIGLAPLPDSDFHKCKHYIKMIEYTGNGIYPIYSNNGPYLRFNKLFNVGTMCANDKNDWIKAIEQLIDNKTLLEKKRQEANEKMCGFFSVKKCSEELKRQLDEKVVITKSSNNVFANIALLKIEGFFKRGISFAQSRTRRVKKPNIDINKTYKKIIKKTVPNTIIKKSKYFDDAWYSKTYNISLKDASKHYLSTGYKSGCNPSVLFDGNLYKKNYPDIGDMNPLLHYEVYGIYENRNIQALRLSDYHINRNEFGKIDNVNFDVFFSTFELLNARIYLKPKGLSENDKVVLVLSHDMDLSGAPIALFNAVLHLKDNGYTPIIISPNDGFLTEKAINNNITVIIYKHLFEDNVLDNFYSLFDFVFINTLLFANFIKKLNGTGNQVIWWLHEGLTTYQFLSENVQSLPDILCNNIHIYAVGDYAKDAMLEVRPRYKIGNLYYFLPDENIITSSEMMFGFETKDKITFGVVGTFEYRKGQDILLQALDEIDEEYSEKIQVVFIGKKLDPMIYDKIKDYKGNISLYYIEKIDRDLMSCFYKKIDCLICPSIDDPMPVVVSEAWKYSVPVICSSKTGSSYLIKEYGGGLVYNYDDPRGLAGKIKKFCPKDNNAIENIKNGLSIYNNFFSKKYFKQAFTSIIETTLNANRRILAKDIVSVVIPTFNGLEDLKNLIPSLKLQKDVNIEIVVVDSGSTDGTVDYLKNENVKLVLISQKEFSHSYARNLGVENSSGKYVLMMTQDALPSSDEWIISLLQPLLKNEAVATMCKQSPRKDCDLYGKVVTYFISKYFDMDVHDSITCLPSDIDKTTLKRNGQLDDVACLIRKDVFDKYQYRGVYKEDLDLGIRLIENGYSIARFASIDVIHSHNRKAFYFLKRAIVDDEIDGEHNSKKDFDKKVASCLTMYICILTIFEKMNDIFKISYNLESFIDNISESMNEILNNINSSLITNNWFDLNNKDEELHDFMIALYKTRKTNVYGTLDYINGYKYEIINSFEDYMKNNNLEIKAITCDEYCSYMLKTFANQSGYLLGEYLRKDIACNDIKKMLGTIRI